MFSERLGFPVVYGKGFALQFWQPVEVLMENLKADWGKSCFSFQLIHSSVVLLPLIAAAERHVQIWQADAFFV